MTEEIKLQEYNEAVEDNRVDETAIKLMDALDI